MTLVSYLEPFSLQRWPDTWVVKLDASAVTSSAEPVYFEVAPHWVPESMQWNANGVPTTLNLRRILGRGLNKDADDYPEREQLMPGTLVVLERHPDDGGVETWFRGWVGQSHMMIQPDSDALNAIAYGPELKLNGIVVRGQWTKTQAMDDEELAHTLVYTDRVAANVWQTGQPCVFNPNGRPNCSRVADNGGRDVGWKLASHATIYDEANNTPCRVFEAPGRVVTTVGETTAELKAIHWTAYRALRSLVEWYDDYNVISYDSSPWAWMQAELDSEPLPEVDVQGMGIADAITAILKAIGYGWCLEPWPTPDAATGLDTHRMHVYSLTAPRTSCSPLLPELGSHATDDGAWRAMVERFEYLKDAHGAKTKVVVMGDTARVQVALDYSPTGNDLTPYWNETLHTLDDWDFDDKVEKSAIQDAGLDPKDFEAAYKPGGSGYPTNREVWRGFGWNEDGHMGPDTIPAMTAFADGAGNVMRRPRPLGPCVEVDRTDAQMRHHAAQVWMGLFRNGSIITGSWLPARARVWTDHAGFTLLRDELLDWTPWSETDLKATEVYAGMKYEDVHFLTCLRNTKAYQSGSHSRLCVILRLMGTVETDEPVIAIGDGAGFLTLPFDAEAFVDARRRFRKRSVTDSGPWSSTTADTRDDQDDCQTYADNLVGATAPPVGHGSMMLRHITRAWHPGTGIWETGGRHIDLTVDLVKTKTAVVSGVRWNFAEGANKTELLLDTQLLGLIQ